MKSLKHVLAHRSRLVLDVQAGVLCAGRADDVKRDASDFTPAMLLIDAPTLHEGQVCRRWAQLAAAVMCIASASQHACQATAAWSTQITACSLRGRHSGTKHVRRNLLVAHRRSLSAIPCHNRQRRIGAIDFSLSRWDGRSSSKFTQHPEHACEAGTGIVIMSCIAG